MTEKQTGKGAGGGRSKIKLLRALEGKMEKFYWRLREM